MPDDIPSWAGTMMAKIGALETASNTLTKAVGKYTEAFDKHIADRQMHPTGSNGRKWLYMGLGIGLALAGGGVGGGLLQLVAVAGG